MQLFLLLAKSDYIYHYRYLIKFNIYWCVIDDPYLIRTNRNESLEWVSWKYIIQYTVSNTSKDIHDLDNS